MTQGPVVVITGGTAGAGRAAALAFAQKGYQVGLLARGVERLAAARREVEASGVRCMAVATDVADADAVEDAASRIETGLGPIDVWVNSAMTSVFSPVHQLEAAEVRRVAEVTYLGSVNRYLARSNVEAQQTDLPVPAGRPDNLEEPMAGSQGAHGIFDDQAKSRSFQSRLSMYRQLVMEASGVSPRPRRRPDR